ncbi:formate dehydrogenase accessory sulfurtransferase FdhD [Melghirimyces algeriensis]|uniref:Sulfur carrier protein FdhD n=1 Tax=Melghirimyces algeriensis TaxID=910412 RepID=A0A521EYQ5_9BACL|nr:formate dehydrogenase accessory sulfurtransferase FdhD [Melghirimyces algeriensis]SMO89162.1 FdhD protein [Melghirimyces algeriensis]
MRQTRSRSTHRWIQKFKDHTSVQSRDSLVVEEPMEIRLVFPHLPEPVSVAVTMRTPGNDFELAAGFLFTEGILTSIDDVETITYCHHLKLDGEQPYNIVNINLRPGISIDLNRLQRNFYTSSSCGVCGKASLEAVRIRGVAPVQSNLTVTPSTIHRLGETLRQEQKIFDRTGGLHAAGWFDPLGNPLFLREDVGRHNAVDKLLGHAFLHKNHSFSNGILMVSGRTSFEIMQKAAVAGIPIVTAISAPSSLACDVAKEFNITLIGFARENRFNVYTGSHRIQDEQS